MEGPISHAALLPPPLVVLPPPAMLMDKGEFEAIRRLTLEHTLEALSEIFGRGFRSLEELFEFNRSIKEPDGLEYFLLQGSWPSKQRSRVQILAEAPSL